MAVTFSDEVLKAMEEAKTRVENLAQKLGMVSLEWANLDRSVDALIVPLLQCSPAHVAALVGAIDSLPSRCEIVRRLIYVESPGDEFRDWLAGCLSRIGSEIAPLRNRYTHDNWVSKNANFARIDKRGQLRKPQSRQPLEFNFDAHIPTSAEDVDRLSFTITAMSLAMYDAARTLQRWRTTGEPQPVDLRWLSMSKPNVRYHTPLEYAQAEAEGRELPDLLSPVS